MTICIYVRTPWITIRLLQIIRRNAQIIIVQGSNMIYSVLLFCCCEKNSQSNRRPSLPLDLNLNSWLTLVAYSLNSFNNNEQQPLLIEFCVKIKRISTLDLFTFQGRNRKKYFWEQKFGIHNYKFSSRWTLVCARRVFIIERASVEWLRADVATPRGPPSWEPRIYYNEEESSRKSRERNEHSQPEKKIHSSSLATRRANILFTRTMRYLRCWLLSRIVSDLKVFFPMRMPASKTW